MFLRIASSEMKISDMQKGASVGSTRTDQHMIVPLLAPRSSVFDHSLFPVVLAIWHPDQWQCWVATKMVRFPSSLHWLRLVLTPPKHLLVALSWPSGAPALYDPVP